MHQFVPDETPTFSRNAVRRDHALFSSTLNDHIPPAHLDADRCKCQADVEDEQIEIVRFSVSNEPNEGQLVNQAFELVLERGTRYIVVDCGGGTVDITVHELDNKMGTLKELYKATGGPYGSVGE